MRRGYIKTSSSLAFRTQALGARLLILRKANIGVDSQKDPVMSVKLLPDSSITTMVKGSYVYAYAQTYEGDIYQFVGNLDDQTKEFRGLRKKSNVIIERLRGKNPKSDAPKLFTPIGAVSFTDNLDKPMSEKVSAHDIFRHPSSS